VVVLRLLWLVPAEKLEFFDRQQKNSNKRALQRQKIRVEMPKVGVL